MILSATASSPDVFARYDSLPPGYTPLKGRALLSEIQDEDLLPLLHSASKNIVKKKKEN